MSDHHKIRFAAEDNEWYVGSMVCTFADVIIPVGQIDGLTDEQIGARVRKLQARAVHLLAVELWAGITDEMLETATDDWLHNIYNLAEEYRDYNSDIRSLGMLFNSQIQKREEAARKAAARMKRRGRIYLAHSETGHYKIGWSTEPERRIKVFDTKMPIKVELVCSFRADDTRAAESALHTKFKSKHHIGEWFNLDPDDVEYIKSLKHFKDGGFEEK